MNISANKGEWSELYALFRLLSDGKLSAGDANLNEIETLIYPIINIIRSDTEGLLNYSIDRDIVLITNDREELARVPISKFTSNAKLLLQKIKEGNDSAFRIDEIMPFREEIHANKIKADSLNKSDITIVVHDPRTGLKPKLGFSIKSQVGGASTLLNPGKITNFRYKLSDNLNNDLVSQINDIKNFNKKLTTIYQYNCKLQFCGIDPSPKAGNRFFNNLILIDYCMPGLIAEMLLVRYLYNKSKIADILEIVKSENPFKLDMADSHQYYECKVKRLLTDIALGMTPAHIWNGVYEANGGYLIVKETGDIICYHIYNKKEFEDYLYFNTYLETPSTGRYEFGDIIVNDNGEQIIKLNLQIRFIK